MWGAYDTRRAIEQQRAVGLEDSLCDRYETEPTSGSPHDQPREPSGRTFRLNITAFEDPATGAILYRNNNIRK